MAWSSFSPPPSFRRCDATKLAQGARSFAGIVIVAVAITAVMLTASVVPASAEAVDESLDDPLGNPLGPPDEAAPDFGAGVGYANINIGDSDSPLDSEDALRFEFWGSFSPFPDVPQLRLGAAFGTGIVFDSGEQTVISNGGIVVVSSSDVPLLTFEPEARLSWRQTFGDSGFFIEPGIAGGGFIANLDFDDEDDFDDFDDDDDDFDEWDATWAARAFINIGIQHGAGAGGIQASYLRGGDLDLGGDAEGDVEEFYIGIFGTVRF